MSRGQWQCKQWQCHEVLKEGGARRDGGNRVFIWLPALNPICFEIGKSLGFAQFSLERSTVKPRIQVHGLLFAVIWTFGWNYKSDGLTHSVGLYTGGIIFMISQYKVICTLTLPGPGRDSYLVLSNYILVYYRS